MLRGEPPPAVAYGVACEVCHKIAHIDETCANCPGLWPGVVTFTRPAGPGAWQVQYGTLHGALAHPSGSFAGELSRARSKMLFLPAALLDPAP